MKNLEIKTPAKINLALNIIGKRPDGYHNIETIFFPVKIFDKLIFEEDKSFSLVTNSSLLNSEKDNLIIKAKEMLEFESGKPIKVKIILEKNIPIGAGLGGGSSDAAATLKGLNKLFDLNLTVKKLSEIALKLGSDVPFFLDPVPSFAESRGEHLIKLDLKIDLPILIVNPGIHIPTKWAYQNINLISHAKGLLEILKTTEVKLDSFSKYFKNDFEELVFNNYPEIGNVKKTLIQLGALFALMSGSGSTLFGIFGNLEKAKSVEKYLKQKYSVYLTYVVH